MRPGDTREVFAARRNSEISQAKYSAKLDIKSRWAFCLSGWVEHIFRHQDMPAFDFCDVRTTLGSASGVLRSVTFLIRVR